MTTSRHGRAPLEPASYRDRHRAVLALLALVGLVAAACGSAKPSAAPSRTPTATALAPSPSPSPSPSPLPSPSVAPASPSPHPTPSRSPSPVHTAASAASSPSPAAASAGAIGLPTPGTYTYALTGSYTTPLSLGAQQYPSGSTVSTAFVVNGTTVMATIKSAADNASTSTTWTYGPSGVVITASNLSYAGLASYDCSYTPPPEALPNPLKAGALPNSTWSGASCSGDMSVNVIDNESVSAAGQTWSVWKVQTTEHYQAQSSINVTITSTVLFSAKAGIPISSDTTTAGTVGGAPFNDHQVATLTTLP